jgi:hypothetical protein
MKRLALAFGLAALAALAAPLSAAPRGFRGGHHRGSVVIVRPSWGWGFGGYWYDPFWYGYGPYYRPYYGGYGYGYRTSGNWAIVDTDVSPESARVYLDGEYIGTADDFDGYPDYLYLRRGHYRLEFRLEGYQPRTIDVDARPGAKIDIDDKLVRIPGAPKYGSYDTPEPRGGVRRFWGKRQNVSVEVTGEDDEVYADGRHFRERPGERADSDDSYVEERDREDRDTDADREEPPRREWRRRGATQAGDTRLMLDVQPSDASIYLDDRFIGTPAELNAGVAVAPGRHTLVVSRPGYRDRRMEVDVSRGETEKVEIRLER